ncbi:MAG TPA: cation-translocating P-type ATPase, partial [Anaerolineae bacterium]|nr:cation-translocating P-type ATPase [Anaerolineae bacterium]
SPWRILWEQLTAVMVIILIAAAIISAFIGDFKDAAAIMVIVILNAALGFSQEYRAEKAIAALKKMAVPVVKVRRDGRIQQISARDLVPGDVTLLEAGVIVPADGRILRSASLRVQEAALTGESEPVEKTTAPIPDGDIPLGDRTNMAFMGTQVTYGRGEAVITGTGMKTELGRIAGMLQTVRREPTPLQRRLEQLGRGLAAAALGIVAVVFVLGVLRGEDPQLMLLTAISMAVAAIPEGLPAVVTIGLALGAQRMLRRQALVRKLPAVETLGSVTVICSDKTGTLTENRMAVTTLETPRRAYRLDDLAAEGLNGRDAKLLVTAVTLCNDAALTKVTGASKAPVAWESIGDPTEGALIVAAARLGLNKAELDAAWPRTAEIPFTSERKRMSTVHAVDAHPANRALAGCPYVLFCKGAADNLLALTRQVWLDGRAVPLTAELHEQIMAANDRLAQSGQRVLGAAFRPLAEQPETTDEAELERELIFLGLVGLIDPPRPEAKEAVQICRAAGIRPVMITGDHPLTAQAIAAELAISRNGDKALAGRQLSQMSLDTLEESVEEVAVYARVSPEHKLKIVQALQDKGHIVAMTGDGVNDAPALKTADIGIAMGVTGTDVAKEAADMVLLDDNFATIVTAVKEGRVIYDNIRKFIKYTLTSNSGEIYVMLLAPFLGMPLPLLPLQILWINLVTDGLPGLALTLEPAERGTMRRRPFHPQENIFGRGMWQHIVWVGLLMGLVTLAVGYWAWRTGLAEWQTMLFTTLTLSQMGHALAVRSEKAAFFSRETPLNKSLLWAVLLTFVLQLAVIYVPFLQTLFKTVGLTPLNLALSLLLSSVVFWGVEVEKWVKRRRER